MRVLLFLRPPSRQAGVGNVLIHPCNRESASPDSQWALQKHIPAAEDQGGATAGAVDEALARVQQKLNAIKCLGLEIGELRREGQRYNASGEGNQPAAANPTCLEEEEEATARG